MVYGDGISGRSSVLCVVVTNTPPVTLALISAFSHIEVVTWRFSLKAEHHL